MASALAVVLAPWVAPVLRLVPTLQVAPVPQVVPTLRVAPVLQVVPMPLVVPRVLATRAALGRLEVSVVLVLPAMQVARVAPAMWGALALPIRPIPAL